MNTYALHGQLAFVVLPTADLVGLCPKMLSTEKQPFLHECIAEGAVKKKRTRQPVGRTLLSLHMSFKRIVCRLFDLAGLRSVPKMLSTEKQPFAQKQCIVEGAAKKSARDNQ